MPNPLIILVPAVAAVGGALALFGGAPAKKKKPQPATGDASAAPAKAPYVPYVKYACPSAPGGWAYGIKPELVDPLYNRLSAYMVTGQQDTENGTRLELSPRPDGTPDLLGQAVSTWKNAGYSMQASPSLAWPVAGPRHVTFVRGDVSPWVDTDPSNVVVFGVGQWSKPPGPQQQAGPPTEETALADLSPAMRQLVKQLGESGPIRVMQSTATDLESEGHPAAADWLRAKAVDRMLTRKATAQANGGYSYKLRAGEKAPYDFAEAYVGDGSRWTELNTPVKKWLAKPTIKIPVNWGDPETKDIPLGSALGNSSPVPGPLPGGGGVPGGWGTPPDKQGWYFPQPTGNPAQPVIWQPVPEGFPGAQPGGQQQAPWPKYPVDNAPAPVAQVADMALYTIQQDAASGSLPPMGQFMGGT